MTVVWIIANSDVPLNGLGIFSVKCKPLNIIYVQLDDYAKWRLDYGIKCLWKMLPDKVCSLGELDCDQGSSSSSVEA